MIVYFVSTKNNRPQIMDIEDELEVFYELIGTDTIDIVAHKIDGEWFEFIVDDNGMLRSNPKVTAFGMDNQPMLVGSLIICKYAGEGELGSLKVNDVKILQKHICLLEDNQGNQWAGIYGLV